MLDVKEVDVSILSIIIEVEVEEINYVNTVLMAVNVTNQEM